MSRGHRIAGSLRAGENIVTERPGDEAALDSRLDAALDETFPASDPIAVHLPNAPDLRNVLWLHPAIREDIGNLTTRRPVPEPEVDRAGAFLFLNHHGPQNFALHNDGLPFGPHPHRGFETLTFILEGALAHRDTAGHESIINAGGEQWMSAGSGLIHEEISPQNFKRDRGPLEILQLWVNLPARLTMTPPRYLGLQRDQIATFRAADGHSNVNLITGNLQGKEGPVHSLTGVFMATWDAQPGGPVRFDGLAGRDVFP
jgi:redox-sensitive bicupin YhaK (pirin superfamily)